MKRKPVNMPEPARANRLFLVVSIALFSDFRIREVNYRNGSC